MSTNLFLVFMTSVLAYLVFIHIISIHFSASKLTDCFEGPVFHTLRITSSRTHPFTAFSRHSLAVFCSHIFISHRQVFATLLIHAAASTHLLFSEATSPRNSLQFFNSSLITCTSILQHMSPRILLAII